MQKSHVGVQTDLAKKRKEKEILEKPSGELIRSEQKKRARRRPILDF